MPLMYSTTTINLHILIGNIDTGYLGLPDMQRPFVWKDVEVRDLFDSMMKGYPVGYLMLWQCPDLDNSKQIGIDSHGYNEPSQAIIDGQQRLTCLYAVIKGKKVINSKFAEKSIQPHEEHF